MTPFAEEKEYRMSATVGTEFVCVQWQTYTIYECTHATRTGIEVGGYMFNRESGRIVCRNGDWFTPSIYKPTDELREKCKRIALVRGTKHRLEEMVKYLPDATNEELSHLYNELLATKDKIFARKQNK